MRTVLKLGGELLEDGDAMRHAAAAIARLAPEGPLVVIHGGGRAIDADLRARGITPRFVDGLRITDHDTLDTVVGVLAGRINTAFVAALNAAGVKAVGITGADAGVFRAENTPPADGKPDLGLVGLPTQDVAPTLLVDLIRLGYVPVIATIGATRDGMLLNVNADVLAAHVARAWTADRLIVAGSTPGVLDADGITCETLTDAEARAMVAAGTARDGMVAKLKACLDALAAGVLDVRIVSGRTNDYLGAPGTRLSAAALADFTTR